MKTMLSVIAAVILGTTAAQARTVLEDFENVAIGTKWTLWGQYGTGTTTATVEKDPKNANNHVLHVRTKDWGVFPEFKLPAELAGYNLQLQCSVVRFRFYRSTSEGNDYKQMHVLVGTDEIYADAGYPHQGDKGVWQSRSYAIKNVPENSTATQFRLGIHENASDYYLDDIEVVGPWDDFVTVPSGKIDICKKNTSTTYASYTTPTIIPEGETLDVLTSRYTDFNAPLAGSGTLNIYGGGERTYLGEHSNKSYPDWSGFTGDVHVYPYRNVEAAAGFYGVIMAHRGKTFSPENIQACISEGKVCNMLENNRVYLHEGAAMAFENGTRAARFGELNTVAGSRIYGYYKASGTPGSYLLVGCSGTDGVLAGRIAPMESNGSPLAAMPLGIIKEGRGTYTITANDNVISGAIRIQEGTVLVNNDAETAKTKKLSGGVGYAATTSGAVVYVLQNGKLGGTGSVGGSVDVYGTIQAGDKMPGTLTISDYAKSRTIALRLHPASLMRVRIASAEHYDRVNVGGAVEFSNACEDFTTSNDAPHLKVTLEQDANLHAGDEFVVLTANSFKLLSVNEWDIVYPSRHTWSTEIRTLEDGTQALVLIVTSLDDDPANAGNDDILKDADTEENEGGNETDDERVFADDGDTNTLRHYADKKGVRVGVAVSSYANLNDTNDAKTKIILNEFNMVVPENALKFDAVEPSQNSFNFSFGDALASLASKNKIYMRGHTLAWHSQVAQWVSSDGKKNDKNWTKAQLMAILKNHVQKVVAHYKGKIGEWDVVNECLDDDQSIVRTNPNGYTLRQQSIWTTVCGEAFIDSAFVWARQADPDVRLYLNDYGNELMGNAKAQAFYNLAKRLKNSGIPIDGVGLQAHFDAGQVDSTALARNISRYRDLDLECCITELDLGVDGNSELWRQKQARDYHAIINIAMEQPNCHSVLIWGVSDDMSWRQSLPLLWNSALEKKPAYYAVRDALRSASDSKPEDSGVEQMLEDSPAVSVQWYSVSGTRLDRPAGICIERVIHRDGTTSVRKIMR